jgi:DNA polymerase III epsilon subunit family exonuclease
MTRPNLVSDSPLVQETVELLRACGGALPAAKVADDVLCIANLENSVAAPLLGALIAGDSRLLLREDGQIELREADNDLRLLHETDFVVVDVETTGAKAPPCRITEIGAYRVSNGRIKGEFQTLVNPQTHIPQFITELTGISNQMVQNAPVFADVAPQFLDFLGDAVLVAHNAPFDVGFLNYELRRVFPGQRLANPQLCTVRLSRRVFPGLSNYKLHTLAGHFSINIVNRHRAAGDAHATAQIFLHALNLLQQNGVRDLAAARRFKTASA